MKGALLVLLLLSARVASECTPACRQNCTALAKAACLADDSCGGVYQWGCFVPGSYVLTLCTVFTRRGAPCTTHPLVKGGEQYYSFLDPHDNRTWIDKVDAGSSCRGADALPNVTGWAGDCYVAPTVPNDCPARPRPAERLVSIWQPGFTPTQGAAIVDSIVAHPGTFNAFSATWAFWNSPYNAKCQGSLDGLCGEAFTPDVWNTTLALRGLGLATVPIVETCCVCVLNASYDFAPAMARLVQDAVAHDFAGYAVDIECGGVDAPRSIDFFNAFGNALRALNKTISFWVHYTERPDFSFPNNASYVYTMDTYRYSTRQFVEGWTTAFACQAGIGLEYAGDGQLASVADMFNAMGNSTVLEAAGIWGLLPVLKNNPMNDLWWAGIKQFRDGWHAAH